MIKFETHGQGVSKIALLGKGEELLSQTIHFYNGRLEQKPKIMPRKNAERIKKKIEQANIAT